MKVVQLNVTCGAGSTGKICVSISRLLTARGDENAVFYVGTPADHSCGRRYASRPEIKLQALFSRIRGNYGFNSAAMTRRLIARLEQIRPDIVHIHNIHGHNCDLRMLFSYLRERKIRILWTFHDCWAFTGYCPHYMMVGCGRWQTGCGQCPQFRSYSFFRDRSAWLYRQKRELFLGQDLTIVTPSLWLAEQVRGSFLKDCPVHVIPNGIDLSLFRPSGSDFRQRCGIGDRFLILGVAFGWGKRKGLDVFLDLAKRLDDRYRIVLMGTDDAVERQLPENIISIRRTRNQQELAQIYTAADLLVNPTREDTLPTVNIESLACGTPVLTFRTGGSPEVIDDSCGVVVECGDVDAMEAQIRRIAAQRPYPAEACRKRAASFDAQGRFAEYIELYDTMIKDRNTKEETRGY